MASGSNTEVDWWMPIDNLPWYQVITNFAGVTMIFKAWCVSKETLDMEEDKKRKEEP